MNDVAMKARPKRLAASPVAVSVCLMLAGEPPLAHDGSETVSRGDWWHAWNAPTWLLLLLGVFTALQLAGLARLRHRRGRLSGRQRAQACSYFLGLSVIVVALLSPLDALAGMLASAHMVQHMLLMVVAAPLLVLAAPLPVWLWALPAGARGALAARSHGWVALAWQHLTAPLSAWLLHGIALWAWHAPSLYQAALRNQLIHDIEHASFFLSALLFWWAVLRSLGRAGARSGLALLLVFTTFMHGGLLAGLMSFASEPWYRDYIGRTETFGLAPLTDQQLAGLIMWIPAGITYLLAGLLILALWMRGMDRTARTAAASHGG